jgi:hypothetical protein
VAASTAAAAFFFAVVVAAAHGSASHFPTCCGFLLRLGERRRFRVAALAHGVSRLLGSARCSSGALPVSWAGALAALALPTLP